MPPTYTLLNLKRSVALKGRSTLMSEMDGEEEGSEFET